MALLLLTRKRRWTIWLIRMSMRLRCSINSLLLSGPLGSLCSLYGCKIIISACPDSASKRNNNWAQPKQLVYLTIYVALGCPCSLVNCYPSLSGVPYQIRRRGTMGHHQTTLRPLIFFFSPYIFIKRDIQA